MTAFSLSHRRPTASTKTWTQPSLSLTERALKELLKDRKFNAEYDARQGSWTISGYKVSLYDTPLKARIYKEIAPDGKGGATLPDGVGYRAETGRVSTTIASGETAWAIARYGNTLLVVEQQSHLLRKSLA